MIITLYHKLSVKDFIAHENAVEASQNASEIVLDDEAIINHEKTTKEIKECCKDIKVLGKKDLRNLINWWKVAKESLISKSSNKLCLLLLNAIRRKLIVRSISYSARALCAPCASLTKRVLNEICTNNAITTSFVCSIITDRCTYILSAVYIISLIVR